MESKPWLNGPRLLSVGQAQDFPHNSLGTHPCIRRVTVRMQPQPRAHTDKMEQEAGSTERHLHSSAGTAI